MIKELCKDMKKLIKKELGKVLAGVLSCCMLLNGCGSAAQDELSWTLEEETVTLSESFEEKNAETESMIMTQEAVIYVYVCGAVENPGVYEIPKGSRLFELIASAGGMLENADVTSQNLARVVQDGEQIQIWTKEETEELKESGAAVVTGSTTQKQGLVNINTASVQELTTLTGIGESRALAIIAYREENGLFQNIDGIKKVAGIKEGLFEKIKNQITV